MASLYGDFQDDDVEETEDDIGALGSLLSWDDDEDDDEDDHEVVDGSPVPVNSTLREQDNVTDALVPPDMLQFTMKNGIPQFNFFSNPTSIIASNLTPQLTMQAPFTKLAEANSLSQTEEPSIHEPKNNVAPNTALQQFQQQTQQSLAESFVQLLAQQAGALFHQQQSNILPQLHQQNNGIQQQPQSNMLQQQQQNNMLQQQQQQNNVVTQQQQNNLLAQQRQQQHQQQNNLLAQQQQNNLLNQQQQLLQQVNPLSMQQHLNQFNLLSQFNAQLQQDTSSNQPSQQVQQHVALQPQQQLLQQQNEQEQLAKATKQAAAQQKAVQQAQQQAVQRAQEQLQVQQKVQQAQQHGQHHQPIQQQPSQNSQQQPQVQLPFHSDANALLRQLNFSQFQQQLQHWAQQQTQVHSSAQTPAAAPISGNLVQPPPPPPQTQTSPAMNPKPPRDGPPPAKKAKKSETQSKAAASKDSRKAPPTLTPALVSAKGGIVSASDTDCDGPKKPSSFNGTGDVLPFKVPLKSKKVPEPKDDFDDLSNLGTDEKAQANRDRNREHARNTRLRKKAYLEKLKGTVEDLCRERDSLVSERANAASLLVEMHNTRTEVLMSFFALRSSNEKRRILWSSILDESSFTCVMPVTPYRSFPASEIQISKCQRTLLGIDSVMADTASLHVLFQSLVDRVRFPDAKIEFRYTIVTEESVVAGNQMMARWVMSTVDATHYGALAEVSKQGMMCCKFNSAHRITGLELMFDVMAFMLQLKQASGCDCFSVIPNTVQTCQRSFDKPMMMMLADPPFPIIQVNKLWEDMSGYASDEVVGRTAWNILDGPRTDKKLLEQLMEEMRFKRPSSALIRNVKKSGEEFQHFLLLFPLSSDSRVTHYLCLSNHVASCKEEPQKSQRENSPLISAMPSVPVSNNGRNVMVGSSLPQFYVAPQPMFNPQPQVVVSKNVFAGAPGQMAPPPNAPSNTMRPPS